MQEILGTYFEIHMPFSRKLLELITEGSIEGKRKKKKREREREREENTQEGGLDQDGNNRLGKMSHRWKEEHGKKVRRRRSRRRSCWKTELDGKA
jgi:hypothetical protein